MAETPDEYTRSAASINPQAPVAELKQASLEFLNSWPEWTAKPDWDRDAPRVAALALQHRFDEASAVLLPLRNKPYHELGFAQWAGFFGAFGDRLGDHDREAAAWFYRVAIDACVFYAEQASERENIMAGYQNARELELKWQTVMTDPKMRCPVY